MTAKEQAVSQLLTLADEYETALIDANREAEEASAEPCDIATVLTRVPMAEVERRMVGKLGQQKFALGRKAYAYVQAFSEGW